MHKLFLWKFWVQISKGTIIKICFLRSLKTRSHLFTNNFLPDKVALLSYYSKYVTPETDMVCLNNMQCLAVYQNIIPQFNFQRAPPHHNIHIHYTFSNVGREIRRHSNWLQQLRYHRAIVRRLRRLNEVMWRIIENQDWPQVKKTYGSTCALHAVSKGCKHMRIIFHTYCFSTTSMVTWTRQNVTHA